MICVGGWLDLSNPKNSMDRSSHATMSEQHVNRSYGCSTASRRSRAPPASRYVLFYFDFFKLFVMTLERPFRDTPG